MRNFALALALLALVVAVLALLSRREVCTSAADLRAGAECAPRR